MLINRSDVNKLINQTLSAREAVVKRPPPRSVDIEDKFNKEHILKMSERLSLNEISLLFSATQLREKALNMLRNEKFAEGNDLLNQSRKLVEQSSKEAKIVAASFQFAAESYYYYRTGSYSTALELIRNSIRLCEIMQTYYGYKAEVRKIHLLKNLVRVLNFAGYFQNATQVSCELIEFLAGHSKKLPLTKKNTATELISDEERWFLFDQILGEMSLLLSTSSPHAVYNVIIIDKLLQERYFNNTFSSVYSWIHAHSSLIKKKEICFMRSAKSFYSNVPHYLKVACRETDRELQKILDSLE